MVSEPARQEIIVDFVFLMVAPAKTPFPSSTIVTSATLESLVIAMSQKCSPSTIAPPPLEIDFKDEFIEEIVEGFYKSVKHYLCMIFKSTRTSFASWRPVSYTHLTLPTKRIV